MAKREQAKGQAPKEEVGDAKPAAKRATNWFELGVAVLALVVAGASALFAWHSVSLNEEQAYLSIYFHFKDRYHDVIRPAIPERSDRTAPTYVPTHEHVEAFKDYWYHSFDEWFASNQLGVAESERLWTTYYGPAIANSILKSKDAAHGIVSATDEGSLPPRADTLYLDVLCQMLNDDSPSDFSGRREEFRRALRELMEGPDGNGWVPPCLIGDREKNGCDWKTCHPNGMPPLGPRAL